MFTLLFFFQRYISICFPFSHGDAPRKSGNEMHEVNQQQYPTLFFSCWRILMNTKNSTPEANDKAIETKSSPGPMSGALQWGAADAEIKVPFGENTKLKRPPFKAWSRSVYSHTCYAYCQGLLPCLFLPFQSIHLHLFQNLFRFFPVLALANTGSCVGPQNKIGQPA